VGVPKSGSIVPLDHFHEIGCKNNSEAVRALVILRLEVIVVECSQKTIQVWIDAGVKSNGKPNPSAIVIA